VQLGPERTIEVKFQVRLWLEANLRQKDLPAEPCVCSGETRLDGVGSLNRRGFLAGIAAAGFPWALPERALAAPFPVRFRRSHPYESLFQFIEPGHDEFAIEKQAAEITAHLERLPQTRSLPLSADFQGRSPMPARYVDVAEGVARAEFDPSDKRFEQGLKNWLDSLGFIRSARFFALPKDRVRYEISTSKPDGLQYRVGSWKQIWTDGRLSRFEPIEETVVRSPRPLFQDVTSSVFGSTKSFDLQLRRGLPHWRARLDSACGIDVYGNNGIAVGDIDGDGWDEVYVCQPGGLPNRLYKNRGDGTMEDITERANVGVLDPTASALFVDFRNIGRQDLVVVTVDAPLLFLNQGDGTFQHKPEAFRFASSPQGAFTGVAAADYDRDGRVDLYLCSYIYFQSEDQYRYPVPYYDSQNGPPNFLFHNELTTEGGGFFQDVTAAAGMNENNNRYSFAPAWGDFNGDGWPDLYVANDFGRNNLYKNEGGRFRDVAAEAGVEDVGPGMSAAWFDYDGDGRPDLYVSNMWTPSGQRVVEDKAFAAAPDQAMQDGYRRHSKGNSLYRNRGDGTFESTEAAEGVEMGRWAWSSDGIDFDNDGSPEIYITCGMLTNSSEKDLMSFFWRQVVSCSPTKNIAAPAYENGWNALNQLIRGNYSWNGREPNVLYARRGARFYDFSGVSGLDCAEDSRAFAITDLDGDGNLDLLLKSRLGPQVRAFQNNWGTARHSIAIELRGTRSNRDGIGTHVEVEHSGKRTGQTLQAGCGYLSQHTKRLHFGLEDSVRTGKVQIRWPSGLKQQFEGLAAGFRHQIVEGSSEIKSLPFVRRKAFSSRAGISGDNRPVFEPTWLLEPVPLPETRKGPGFLCLWSGRQPTAPPGMPFHAVEVTSESSDLSAWYALFRMYLFDYRTDPALPLLLLTDERGLAHKIYPAIPDAFVLRADLELLQDASHQRLALPFPGRYYTLPRRNYFRLGAAFYWAGYPEQALIYFDEVVRSAPANSKAHLAIGHIHLEAGRYGPAREHLEKAVKLNPDSADAWINLGGLETAVDDYTAGLRAFEKALTILPDSAFALVSAGRAHSKLGHARAAEDLLLRALLIEPQNAEASNQLGLLFAAQNRIEEARKHFEQAIASQRDHTGAINNLGVLYIQMHKPQDAIAAFRYGIQVAPDDETSYLNLARVYVMMGDRVRGREILQQLLSRQPSSAAAKRGLAELIER
jgi:tetratricopeptide (TPR) repeat protein